MRDYKIGIAIKDTNPRNKCEMFNTGFTDVEDAVRQANEMISKKFGAKEQLELTRPHKRARR